MLFVFVVVVGKVFNVVVDIIVIFLAVVEIMVAYHSHNLCGPFRHITSPTFCNLLNG